MECAVGGCRLAEKAHDRILGLVHLLLKCRSSRDRDAGSDYHVTHQEPYLGFGEVHLSAESFAYSVALTIELGHQAVHRAALGNEVAERPVVGDHLILPSKDRADSRRHGLLSRIGMYGQRSTALRVLKDCCLKRPYPDHVAV